jgi:uncharacterized protein (TIGR02145 family)
MKNSHNFKFFSTVTITSVFLLFISCGENSTTSLEEADEFQTCGDIETDVDGNSYQTVQIGDQCWLAEDLRTTKYRDGSTISNVSDNNEWAALSTGGWAYYANNDLNSDINGKLYNWFAVNNSNGICPSGWKVPTDNDWKILETELGMTLEEANNEEWRGSDMNVGERLQDVDGFSAILGGSRASNGVFSSGGRNGIWWSSSEVQSVSAWTRLLRSEISGVYRNNSNKSFGLSVRCLLN